MIKALFLFLLGFICLIKGGDLFVDGAVDTARHFNMPEALIGATVVSIGTTIPEVMVSVQGAVTGGGSGSAIAYGNAIGSVICNTSLIAAITMAVRPGVIEKKGLLMPGVFFFISALVYAFTAYKSGFFGRRVGALLLLIFIIYISFSVKMLKKGNVSEENISDENISEEKEAAEKPFHTMLISIVTGAIIIAIGARLLVQNGTVIAKSIGVPDSVIALTMVALGTSLPELITAVTSLIKGHSDLSLGNVLGANLLNLVLVSGLASFTAPFMIPSENSYMGINASLLIDIPVMFLVMIIMLLPALIKGRIYRLQGIILLLIYFFFVMFQFLG